MGERTYVGFGFGPIQSGLFAYEALKSGNFSSVVVAEIDGGLVEALRDNGGYYCLNVAHRQSVSAESMGPVRLLNPMVPDDRRILIEAIAAADELGTALPSVAMFAEEGEGSVVSLLAEGLSKSPAGHRRVVYCAENHNRAAEILRDRVKEAMGGRLDPDLQFLNTVIGKMSGVIADAEGQSRLKLARLAPRASRAVLVEEFDRILITRISLPSFRRGLGAFEEKADLLPFEEAKLYGHNAIHALIGYLARARGYEYMSEAGEDPRIMEVAREAFIRECGAGLLHRYRGVDDLFTEAGYEAYAEDLLARIVNPNLADRVSRVIRDSGRKLGWDDRLIGAMRLALAARVAPVRLALGAKLAMLSCLRESWERDSISSGEADAVERELLASMARGEPLVSIR